MRQDFTKNGHFLKKKDFQELISRELLLQNRRLAHRSNSSFIECKVSKALRHWLKKVRIIKKYSSFLDLDPSKLEGNLKPLDSAKTLLQPPSLGNKYANCKVKAFFMC